MVCVEHSILRGAIPVQTKRLMPLVVQGGYSAEDVVTTVPDFLHDNADDSANRQDNHSKEQETEKAEDDKNGNSHVVFSLGGWAFGISHSTQVLLVTQV